MLTTHTIRTISLFDTRGPKVQQGFRQWSYYSSNTPPLSSNTYFLCNEALYIRIQTQTQGQV